jgi:hypothetical protein
LRVQINYRRRASWLPSDGATIAAIARRPDGIFVAPFEQGEIGPELFRADCNMGLEVLFSKSVADHQPLTVTGSI